MRSTKQQTKAASWWTRWSIAAKGLDISLKSWWRPKTEQQKEWILVLHSSGEEKCNSEKMLMLLHNRWVSKQASVC